MIPDSIKQFKPKGTEIQEHKGHYYVYKVKAYYDRDAGKPKRKSLGCIGQIHADLGFVPNEKSDPFECQTVEYGATRLLMETSKPLFEKLRECFPSDFLCIYTLAVLKLLNNARIKDIGVAYKRSAISVLLPKQHLGKNTIPTFLAKLSEKRGQMLQFMRKLANYEGDSILFDGSSFLSEGKTNPFVEKGYCPGQKHKKQIRLMYAFNKDKKQAIYFNVLPGNIPDKLAFENSLAELGPKDCTVILDKGFYSKANINYIQSFGCSFILPLPENTTEVSNTDKDFTNPDYGALRRFEYHKRGIFYKTIESAKFPGCKVHVYYDNERRKDLIENFYHRNQDGDGNLPADLETNMIGITKMFGVTMLLTNRDCTVKEAYYEYKTRWAIEEMFDTQKNTLAFTMQYETGYETAKAWAFIEFLSIQMYYCLNHLLLEKDILKVYDVKDILFRASCVEQVNINGKWVVSNLTKSEKDLFQNLGVTIEHIP